MTLHRQLAVATLLTFATASAHAAVVPLTNATADFSQTGFPVSAAIDGVIDASTGWAVHPAEASNHAAVFQVSGSPVNFGGTEILTFTLTQIYANPGHTIGKLRLSTTGATNPTVSTIGFITLQDVTFSSASGQVPVSIGSDGTILLPAAGPGADTYTISGLATALNLTGVRLEVLTDASLPHGGSGRFPDNGNFVLSEFQMSASAVPEPGMMALIVPCAAGMLVRRRR